MNVLLTNSNYVKSITNLSDNVSDKYIFPAINSVQEIQLKSILGERLLAKLKELVQDGSIETDANAYYKEVLTKSQIYIAYSVVADLTVTLSFKLDEIGLYRTSDENITYADSKEVDKMQEYYQNKSDFFKLELQNYILNNRSKLPEVNNRHIHMIKANLYSAESCGLVLGGARAKKISHRLRDTYYKG